MTQRLSDIGAYLTAVVELQADAETAEKIARMLGIADPTPVAPLPVALPQDRPVPFDGGASQPLDVRDAPVTEPRPNNLQQAATPAPASGAVHVTKIETQPVGGEPLPILSADPPFELRPLPFEPLLRSLIARSIVSAAIAGRRPGRRIDIKRAIHCISRLRPLDRFPWRLDPAVPGAVQIVIDRGPGMSLFNRDADDLTQRIRAVAGRDRTTIVRIWETPYTSAARQKTRFPLPPPRSVVIALTDLNIAPVGRARPTHQWATLASELRASGSKLVAFVPYPRQRWPISLARELPIIMWDRSTGPSRVRRALVAVRALR